MHRLTPSRQPGSDAPPQPRCVDRRIPELREFVVEPQQSDRESGHLEAGDVVADEASADLDALALEDLVHTVEGPVELDQRRPANPVHEREDAVAALEPEV